MRAVLRHGYIPIGYSDVKFMLSDVLLLVTLQLEVKLGIVKTLLIKPRYCTGYATLLKYDQEVMVTLKAV